VLQAGKASPSSNAGSTRKAPIVLDCII